MPLGWLRDGCGKQDDSSYPRYTYTYERQPGQTIAQGRNPGEQMDKAVEHEVEYSPSPKGSKYKFQVIIFIAS